MATPTQFRHYLISQDADGGNIEVARSSDQVAVLAFDSRRLEFVHCHVLLEPPGNRQSFEDRTRKLSDNGHPLVARVLDFGEDEGSTFYITENVDGETLGALLSRQADLPVWLALKLTELSLAALQALAKHGDYVPLQPLDSLRVLQTGPCDLRVHVSDFRLADFASPNLLLSRQAKPAFDKQTRFITDYFKEQSQNPKTQLGETVLNRGDFTEVLVNLLLACGPETVDAIGALRQTLTAQSTTRSGGELSATFKPRPLIGPLLATFQEVARSVNQTVRLQSQKLDAGRPYALRGTLMKSGQPIIVEQVPPARLTGIAPVEALRQARNLPKTGKFPNLVPVVFVEDREGLECVAETAVEGVTLGDLLAVRGVLEAREVYQVLVGVDIALGQLEKAARAVRRLRLEDIFLFTGSGKDSALESGLMKTPLHEWPGFSIVLRGHPCLHAMSGRGTDPGLLLPIEPASMDGSEALWNGGWMAALGSLLIGSQEGATFARLDLTAQPVLRLLREELSAARRGRPGTRASLLARLAPFVQESEPAAAKVGGIGMEMSGSTNNPGGAPQAPSVPTTVVPSGAPSRRVTAPTQAPLPNEEPELLSIGFAEALIRPAASSGTRLPGEPQGPMDAAFESYSMESSWTGFREEKPVWIRVTTFAVGALIAGALLAHLQGRALWQARVVPPVPAVVPEAPVKPTPEKKKTEVPAPEPVKEEKPSLPKLTPPQKPIITGMNLDPVPKKAVPIPESFSERLHQVRLSGARLPEEWRAETESAAKDGVTEAMIVLGTAMLRGESGTVDERAAFAWFEKAAQAGDNSALVSLAGCYLQGWGTAPDFPQAVSLLTRAATGGDSTAKDLLGVCYARGLGVARDDAKAFELVREAHVAGVPSACGNLGAMYLRGQGVPADPVKAAGLFAEGSKKGHAESMLLYAQSLENGIGLHADPIEASRWYQQAARLGNGEAADWCRRQNVAF